MTNNILTHTVPIAAMGVIIVASIYLGGKIEKLETLNENITTYMETYNAERFVTLEQKLLSLDTGFDARVIALVKETFFE